jgi:L-asparaginase II
VSEILAEVTRGGLVESRHHGDLVVVDALGQRVMAVGDPGRVTFMRSAAKPFQAIPLVESGAVDAFGISDSELGVIVASHNGEARHIQAVQSILNKIGVTPEVLECGSHPPLGREVYIEMARRGELPAPIHNNCSGKHAGMLALCRHLGLDTRGYREMNHPVQSILLEAVSSITSHPSDHLAMGSDGCGVPVYALALSGMALAYARMSNPRYLRCTRAGAVTRVREAMMKHPHMVAGDGRLCTNLMVMGQGRFVAKLGAEGVYCLGVLEKGLGLALKIDDGSERAIASVLIRALVILGALGKEDPLVARYGVLPVVNALGEQVGEIRPSFG